MTSITDRLKELMGGASVLGFAKRCGIPGTTMRQYLAGSVPGADKAAQIAERTGVSLVWLVTGRGPKAADAVEATSPVSARAEGAPDPELFGRVVDRVARVYRDEGVRLAEIDLGRIAAERFAEVLDLATDQDEWPALLDVVASRVRKAIRAAAADPTSVKRQA
jgi:transcriptional regulator with XRE-family HTH domain